jgi:ABC-type uncharacterized transport system YnjBCD permease subunit
MRIQHNFCITSVLSSEIHSSALHCELLDNPTTSVADMLLGVHGLSGSRCVIRLQICGNAVKCNHKVATQSYTPLTTSSSPHLWSQPGVVLHCYSLCIGSTVMDVWLNMHGSWETVSSAHVCWVYIAKYTKFSKICVATTCTKTWGHVVHHTWKQN